MHCPICHNGSKVMDSRKMGGYVWRRRICKECGERFTTVEIISDRPLPNKGKIVKELKRAIGDEAIDAFKTRIA